MSNVYEQAYHDLRKEEIPRCLSWGKRRDLFRCLEMATGRELVVLSSPPKATERRSFRWLRPAETKFCSHRQLFCGNWDGPKLRVPLSWLFYALHVRRHTRSGDVVVIDNYELIYILAAWLVRICSRVKFVLDYEDGKHLIDRSWHGLMSGLAERLGRPLLQGALLAHPALGNRLPASIPRALVPGFLQKRPEPAESGPDGIVHFLYSGSLDTARGIELLLQALDHLPEKGWRLNITGTGPLSEKIERFCDEPRWKGKVTFHYSLPTTEFERLAKSSQAGLNCQRSADPISGVTFPSKVFGYLAAGLLVISSKASEVEPICGRACLYYTEETPAALAAAMARVIEDFSAARREVDETEIFNKFSLEGTADRLQGFMKMKGVLENEG